MDCQSKQSSPVQNACGPVESSPRLEVVQSSPVRDMDWTGLDYWEHFGQALGPSDGSIAADTRGPFTLGQ
jgi:hypothetical protein